ncbi:MAG: hypothetical protein PCFJNLEI_03878 [Verrucomicrobiae bacterium]|nr:hypothetical protein [Verrucomicrobiae bacterium]
MFASTYACPFCRAEIRMDDVNVATDLALCRACGKTSSFAVVAGGVCISAAVLRAPPRGIRVENDFRGGQTITYRRVSLMVLFLIPFTAVWSGISMWGIYGQQLKKHQFDLSQSLFGLPFLFGTIVLLSVIVFMLFGKWVISLSNGAGTVFVGVGPVGWRRSFTFNRTTAVSMRMTNIRHNNVPQQAILLRTGDKDFVFGTGLRQDAKEFVAAAIMQAASRA